LATLEDVVEHDSTGGVLNPNSAPTIQPLNLTGEEKTELEESGTLHGRAGQAGAGGGFSFDSA